MQDNNKNQTKPVRTEMYAHHTEAFSYTNLHRLKNAGHLPILVDYNDYFATFYQGSFRLERKIQLECYRRHPTHRTLVRIPTYGWKFQISIDDTNSTESDSNLARAWNIIEQYIIDNAICYVKLFSSGVPLHEQNPYERGKQITIYLFKEERERRMEEWQKILQCIENTLADERIIPSYRAYSCRAVPGSHYFSYRNDKGPTGQYIGAIAADGCYNLSGELDPYAQMLINTPRNAPPPPTWQEPIVHRTAI